MDKNLKHYDDTFFKQHEAWRADYDVVSMWIDKNVTGKTFGDVGCGNAYMIACLHRIGKKVWGVDAANNFEQYVDKEVRLHVKNADLTKAQKFDKSDVVLCFEVAEHIEKKYADTLVKSIVSAGSCTILFTAAKPGQGGTHHINLQPQKYWLDKFRKYGYYLDVALTEKFKDDLAKDIKTTVWYIENIMILQKFDRQKMLQAYDDAGSYVKELKQRVAELSKKNTKLEDELWAKSQELSSIVNSKRWQASSSLIRIIKR